MDNRINQQNLQCVCTRCFSTSETRSGPSSRWRREVIRWDARVLQCRPNFCICARADIQYYTHILSYPDCPLFPCLWLRPGRRGGGVHGDPAGVRLHLARARQGGSGSRPHQPQPKGRLPAPQVRSNLRWGGILLTYKLQSFPVAEGFSNEWLGRVAHAA